MYDDDTIRSLMCCVCARIRLDSGGARSHIEFKRGGWLLSLPRGSLSKNFSQKVFAQRYQQAGSPLADRGAGQANADFTQWRLRLHPKVLREALGPPRQEEILEFATNELLCCPEDHRCQHGCPEQKLLCRACKIPVCTECQVVMQRNEMSAMALVNDNVQGFLEE